MKREIKFRGWVDGLMGKGMHYGWGCFTDDSNKNYVITDDDRIKVNVLMQFTGLKDKNGKEIYEGDILKHMYGGQEYKTVEFRDCAFFTGQIPLYTHHYTQLEIIGNIYENPELLVQLDK